MMATHSLIPRAWREALAQVAKASGRCQSQLVSTSVGLLLLRMAQAPTFPTCPLMPEGVACALVVRIPAEQVDALHALYRRTRVQYSEWMRQAVWDVLVEYGAAPQPPSDLPATCVFVPAPRGRCSCGLRLAPGESAPCEDCREAA